MTAQLTVEAFALEVADFFRRKDYPFLGVEIKPGKPFPLVMLWDDDAQISRVIACTCDEDQLENAAEWARLKANIEEVTGNAPCGAVGCGVWPGGWREIDG